MSRIGPITTKYAIERTESPSLDEMKETVRWVVSVENSALASFYFMDNVAGEMSDSYQLIGPHHHLSALDDQRIDRARSLLSGYGASEEKLEPRMYQGYPSMDVELSGLDTNTHVAVAVEVLEDVYNMAPDGLSRIERTTHELDREETDEKMAICHRCATSLRVGYMLKAYGDVYYRALESEDSITDDHEFDFIFSKAGWWICAKCFSLEERLQ